MAKKKNNKKKNNNNNNNRLPINSAHPSAASKTEPEEKSLNTPPEDGVSPSPALSGDVEPKLRVCYTSYI